MKNNKGYYSWIHSLNEAAIKSQHEGQRIINEAKEVSKGKKKQLNESRKDDNWEGPNLPREEFYNLAKQIADLLKQDGGITPESIARAEGDPEEYKKVRELKVKDANGDGTKNGFDVVTTNNLDASDGIQDTKVGPRFTNPIGAQARLEMGHGVEGDEELARGEEPLHVRAARDAEMERRAEDEDYGRRAGMPDPDKPFRVSESVNQKISRILKERFEEEDPEDIGEQERIGIERGIRASERGALRPGGITSAYDPEGVPFRFFEGAETPDEKIKRIMEVAASIGTGKHKPSHEEYAHNAMISLLKMARGGKKK